MQARGLLSVNAILLACAGLLGSAPLVNAATPEVVCRFEDRRLDEISGMAMSIAHPGVLYVHNDSSGGPYLYAVSSTTCKVLARLQVDGAKARDFEAIASGRDAKGRPVLWVGDIGDNLDSWEFVELLRVREPAQLADQVLRSRRFRFTYADRPHNAETLLADPRSGRLWVVTKQLARGSLYALPEPLRRGRVNVAKPIRAEGGIITDGAVAPDGSSYVLRDYFDAVIYRGLPPGREVERIYLPSQPQGESITWSADGRALLIASERDDRLLRVSIPSITGR
jgi:hypothetical protein